MKKILLFLLSFGCMVLNKSNGQSTTLTIGSGAFTTTSNAYGIMRSITTANSWNRNAYIYPSSLLSSIPANSTIDTLQFYASNASSVSFPTGTNFKLYIKNTTSVDFGSGNLDWTTESATATLVYSSDPASIVGSTSGFKKFPLSSSFTYTGGNLEILVEYTQTTAPTASILWTYDSDAGVPAYTVNQGKYINGTGSPTTTLSSSNQRHPNMKITYTPFVYANDMTVSAFVAPANSLINNGVANTITVAVKNNGSATQTNVPVYYRVDDGTPIGPVLTGSLAQNATANITLPSYTPTSGYHTIKAYTALTGEQNVPNDTLSITVLAGPITTYPFMENFTNAIGWTANLTIWSVTTITTQANGGGGKAAMANFYNSATTVAPDTLRTPVLNFSGLTKPILNYNFSHPTYTSATPEPDSLKIVVSVDGGLTWSSPIFKKSANGSPSLNTIAASTTQYNPQAKGDWRHEIIDLSAYAGQANVKIGFIAVSGYGNQLVLDNVLITNAIDAVALPVNSTGAQSNSVGANINFSNIIPNGTLKIAKYTSAPTTSASTAIATNTTATTQDGSIFTPSLVSNELWYTVTYDSIASYSISIDITSLLNAPVKTKLYILKRACQNDSWQALSTTLSGNILTASGLTGFSDFAIGGDLNNPSLPIVITSFNGYKQNNENVLQWTTANETNNFGFELQRSINGTDFSTITKIASKADNGNSATSLNYSYSDKTPLKGTNYYRLYQLDKDGKGTYSKVVVIKSLAKGVEISNVYPNPAKDNISLTINSVTKNQYTISIYDLIGKEIARKAVDVNGSMNVQFNTSDFTKGTYIIKVTSSENTVLDTQRFIKQ